MTEQEEIQQRLAEVLAQHSSYLHRASTATVNQILTLIDDTGSELAREIHARLDNLSPAELTAFASGRYTTSRLEGLRNVIEAWAEALGSRIDAVFAADGLALAGYEASYMASLLSPEATAVTGAAVYEAALAQPVLGELVEDMLSGIAERARRQVYSTIRQGVTEGQSSAQIIKALRGTPALSFKDGVLQVAKNQADSIVRTARAHISSAAYDETYRALGVKTLVWSAMLELRTCSRCAPLDGRRFAIDKPHPKNPLHPRCRCTLIPLIADEQMGERPFVRALKVTGRDGNTGYRSIGRMTPKQREAAGLEVGQVSAKTSFAQWFDTLPERFQREWLGPAKFKLYKDGGYTIDRFSDPRNRAYTLDELRQQDAATFRELFGDDGL